MNTLYGNFDDLQFDNYKVVLHKKLFWLLLYKDPKICKKYEKINVSTYLVYLQKSLNGLNELLLYPEPMVRLMSTIQAIMIELRKENFDWKTYRSLVLSAHKIVDEL